MIPTNLSAENPEKTKVEEFSELLRCYGNLAYRMAYQITSGHEQDARDLVQDAFIKVWRYWKSQQPSAFKGWMYRIIHNLYMDALRKKSRQKTYSLDAQVSNAEDRWEETIAGSAPSPAERIEQGERVREVARALEKLELDFRMPVVLCDMEGLSYDEIAQIMSCPVGTVRSRIHRGRAQLRTLLGHVAETETNSHKELRKI